MAGRGHSSATPRNRANGALRSPTSTDRNLTFVTATKPSDFKAPRLMKQVRSTVMHSYLDKAKNDPTSTDKRVTKRFGSAQTKAAPPTSLWTADSIRGLSSSPSTIDTPSEASTHPRIRADSHVNDDWDDQHFVSPEKDEFLARSREDSRLDLLPWHCVLMNMMSAPTTPTETSSMDVTGAEQLPRKAHSYPGTNQVFRDFMFSPRMQIFWGEIHDALGDSGLNIALLKRACMKFFGSDGMVREWLPYMASPASFLASLSVSAPYSDLMHTAQPHNVRFMKGNHYQTLEIVNVLPQVLLRAVAMGPTDFNIAAVLQFLCGQLSSAYSHCVPDHQACLKEMVIRRGGLAALEPAGVLPMVLSITNMEASFLRNERADDMYLAFATNNLERSSYADIVWSPQDLLIRPGSGSPSMAGQMPCTPSIGRLLGLIANLTNDFLRRTRLKDAFRQYYGPGFTTNELFYVEQSIHSSIKDIHAMLPASFPGHDGYDDHIYEALRLTSILYSSAIHNRVPLNKAGSQQSPFGCAQATPWAIHQEMAKTDLYGSWGPLTGVLHWVAMVAGAACHQDDKLTEINENQNWATDDSRHVHLHRSATNNYAGEAYMKPELRRAASAPSSGMEVPWLRHGCELGVAPDRLVDILDEVDQKMSAYVQFEAQGSSSCAVMTPSQYSHAPQSTGWQADSCFDFQDAFATLPPYKTPLYQDSATFTRCFLVANAVRSSILLRFDHTRAVVKTLLALSKVRDALARG